MAERPSPADGEQPPDATPPVPPGATSMGFRALLLRPWPARRIRLARLVLVALLLLGPVAFTVGLVFLVPERGDRVLVATRPLTEPESLSIQATLRSLDPSRGEVTARLVLSPGPALRDPADGVTLVTPVRLIVNDIAGNTVFEFAEGEIMRSLDVVLSLEGSRATRYPFDNYRTRLVIAASAGEPAQAVRLPLELRMTAALDGFRADATQLASAGPADIQQFPVEITRDRGVVVWSVAFMTLAWLLAVGCATIVWSTVVFGAEIPLWTWGFFAGVLFALPSLRAGLPGSPPYGSLVDWASFYWAVAIVAASLVLLIVIWNLIVRHQVREAADAAEAAASGNPDRE